MKIWKLGRDVDNYENLAWGNDEYDIDLDFIQSFNGASKAEGWIPIQLKRMCRNRKFSNTPGLSSHIPVFDKKAVEITRDYLSGNAEILPVLCGNKEFYAINVTKVIDCIDYEAANYKTFRDGKRIMLFTRYAFIEKKLENIHIFKIKDEPLRSPFVSDELKRKISDSDLTGFKFELVWDSENN